MKRPEKINGGYQPSSLHHGEGTPKPPKGGTGKTEPKHTFPTWEEFQEWSPFVHQDTKVIYDYFRNRMTITEFPKVGEQYEFQHLPEQGWYRKKLLGFKTTDSPLIWQSIRPIQPDPTPKREVVLEAVKNARNAQDGDMVMIHDIIVDAVIKLLEESK
jgi:hypothetical protein